MLSLCHHIVSANLLQSIVACFILLVFTMLAHRRRSRSANRAQQVVLACAIFDEDGRIMVTPEGSLPNRKVTTSNMERVRILYSNIHTGYRG
jgi:hypothetical protein